MTRPERAATAVTHLTVCLLSMDWFMERKARVWSCRLKPWMDVSKA